MANWDSDFCSEGFAGVARLFPLPNLVMFPHVIQPLHIFEMRYRAMLEQSLDSDQLIAMALLKPGWESGYEGTPPIERTVCLGRVVSHSRQPDGCYNILVLGQTRARIDRELPLARPYREAEVTLLEDVCPLHNAERRAALQHRLLGRFRQFLPAHSAIQEQLQKLADNPDTLGMLTDVVSFALPMEAPAKQQLLDQLDVECRAAMLLEHFENCETPAADEGADFFPPPFSDN